MRLIHLFAVDSFVLKNDEMIEMSEERERAVPPPIPILGGIASVAGVASRPPQRWKKIFVFVLRQTLQEVLKAPPSAYCRH